MAQISEHINSSNQKIHSYDQMSRIIVNLGSKKVKNNNNPYTQLTYLHNSLLMSIYKHLKIINLTLKGNIILGKYIHLR